MSRPYSPRRSFGFSRLTWYWNLLKTRLLSRWRTPPMVMHEDCGNTEGFGTGHDPHLVPDADRDSINAGYRGAAHSPANYIHRTLTRDAAIDISIEFGTITGMPTRRIMHGQGYDLVVPAEWVADQLKAKGGKRSR